MTPTEIRQAQTGDADEVSEILLGAARWLDETGQSMWKGDELSPENTFADIDAGLFHVALRDGVIACVLKFQLEDELFWPDHPPGQAGYIHRLAVRREFAGSGIAAAHIDWAKGHAREVGRDFLRLDTEASRPRLRAFYERCGFLHHSDREVGPYFVSRYECPLG